MTDRRQRDALTDETIDHEIQLALAVDPSPEFCARVRTRISSESGAAPWYRSWAIICGGAVVVLLLALGVSRMTPDTTSNDRAPQFSATTGSGDVSISPSQDIAEVAPALSTPRAANPRGRAVSRSAVEFGALIPPAETVALRRLLVDAAAGRVDLSTLGNPPQELQPLGEIALEPIAAITPISVEPLILLIAHQGEIQ